MPGHEMYSLTDDLRVRSLRPLISPAILMDEIAPQSVALDAVVRGRKEIENILMGRDPRLVVVVGPCSVHDPKAALEYATKLKPLADELNDRLFIAMRTYFEKPRTTVGWKGLINDPDLDGSFNINKGLRAARGLLRDLAEMGLPSATEFLDPITPQFVADLVSWGAIGARTTESQVHRELASGLSMPVGFKNGTRGTIQIAIDAMRASRYPHHFLSVTKQGITAIVATAGNESTHLILRGSERGPNYDADSIAKVETELNATKLPSRVMVDCSHGNSGKDHRKQPVVAEAVAEQLRAGSKSIFGVMLESFLVEGSQRLITGKLTYGQSVTDSCMGWDTTATVLHALADAVPAPK